ncbi:MAG: transcription termination factor NusA [Proteobacteria bacterium]|nr:transcription termination factor NusA [Pseudomonadota bacterium]
MKNFEILEGVTEIARNRGLNKEYVVNILKESILTGAKRKFGRIDNLDVKISIDTGDIEVYQLKKVVRKVEDPVIEITKGEAKQYDEKARIGSEIQIPLDLKRDFGRNAIFVMKQVIAQKVREAEKERSHKEFKAKIGEIITGNIQKITSQKVILNLNKADGILLKPDQIPGEFYRQGQPLRALMMDVIKSKRGIEVMLSRTSPKFLERLFQFEVPEIFEGTVVIKNIARDPGRRSKIAVQTLDDKIDPIGSCIGVRGSRIQAIMNELNREKIDVIQWSSDRKIFTTRSLQPAKVSNVILDERENKAIVVVPDSQIALAIGKDGQNLRLAIQLTGMDIELISESDFKKTPEKLRKSQILVIDMPGLSPTLQKKLLESRIDSAQDILTQGIEKLTTIPGVGKKTAEKIYNIALELVNEKK